MSEFWLSGRVSCTVVPIFDVGTVELPFSLCRSSLAACEVQKLLTAFLADNCGSSVRSESFLPGPVAIDGAETKVSVVSNTYRLLLVLCPSALVCRAVLVGSRRVIVDMVVKW